MLDITLTTLVNELVDLNYLSRNITIQVEHLSTEPYPTILDIGVNVCHDKYR